MIEEIEMGISRKEAFERLAERIDIFEVTMFTSSIVQSIEKGSMGIVEVLKKQSDEMWNHRKELTRELAEKASIKLFFPLLLFVLPAMMIFLLSPAIFSLKEFF